MALADFERLAHEAGPDANALRRRLATTPRYAALPTEHEASGQVIGFGLHFHHDAAFLTRRGSYLEDLYVKPTLPKIRISMPLYGWQSGISANWPCCVMRSQGPGGRWGNWLTETLPSQSRGT